MDNDRMFSDVIREMLDAFIDGDDKNYDSIREMNAWITRQRKAK